MTDWRDAMSDPWVARALLIISRGPIHKQVGRSLRTVEPLLEAGLVAPTRRFRPRGQTTDEEVISITEAGKASLTFVRFRP